MPAAPPLPPFLVLVLQSVSFPAGGGVVLGVPARIAMD